MPAATLTGNRSRTFIATGALLLVVAGVLLIGRLDLIPSGSVWPTDRSHLIMWGLDDQHPTDPNASVIRIYASEPYCTSTFHWDSRVWHEAPKVVNTPTSVIVSLPAGPTFDRDKCWPASQTTSGKQFQSYSLNVEWIEVDLGQPLAGRLLFDGAQDPPMPRPYD